MTYDPHIPSTSPRFQAPDSITVSDVAAFRNNQNETLAAFVQDKPKDSTRSAVTGMKHDSGKEPLSLLSKVWLLGVARVLDFGARKYASHNWRGGIERSRLISAAFRHLLSYNEGEDFDPETGLSHLDHASCCLMFARELHETRPDLDDRYKGGK